MVWTVTTEVGKKEFPTALKAYRYAREYVQSTSRQAHPDPFILTDNSAKIVNSEDGDCLIMRVVPPALNCDVATVGYARKRDGIITNGIIKPSPHGYNGMDIDKRCITFHNYAKVAVCLTHKTRRVGMKTINKIRRVILNNPHITIVSDKHHWSLGDITDQLTRNYGVQPDHLLYVTRTLTLDSAIENKDFIFVSIVNTAGSVHQTRIIHPIGTEEHLLMAVEADDSYTDVKDAAFRNKVAYHDGMVDVTASIKNWDRFYITVGEHSIQWANRCVDKQSGRFAIFVEPEMETVLVTIL